ncbi:hypothetical protein TWF506_004395 [Arthrobotrys conoides]|uniref:Uncharacterized protein n=1 Tax=Arthrobotrys conoides TaxID=74498 RepID=A0AAN8N6N1_9PEZI
MTVTILPPPPPEKQKPRTQEPYIPPPDPIVRPHYWNVDINRNPLSFEPFTVTFYASGDNEPMKLLLTKVLKLIPNEFRAVWECTLPDGTEAVVKYWGRQCTRGVESFRTTLKAHRLFPADPFIPDLHFHGEITTPLPQGHAIILQKRPGVLLSTLQPPRSETDKSGIIGHLKLIFGLLKISGYKHTTIYYDNLLWDDVSNTLTVTGWTGLVKKGLWEVKGGFDEELFEKVWSGRMVFVERPVDAVRGTRWVEPVRVGVDKEVRMMWLPR